MSRLTPTMIKSASPKAKQAAKGAAKGDCPLLCAAPAGPSRQKGTVLFSGFPLGGLRRAVTLVELLVTVAIISIIAGAVLFAMVGAQNAAKEARTKAIIASLHSLLMERYESYATRRVGLNVAYAGATSTRDSSAIRLAGIRRLMQLEMPERWNEVNNPAITPLSNRPALSEAYKNRYDSASPSTTNQSAECLFLVITLACGDGEAREHFSDQNIGDTDGDGAPEFIDGWGNPIGFYRWPAGFESPFQSRNSVSDHDPFDPLQGQSEAYRLLPLIYSSGMDGIAGLTSNGVDGSGNIIQFAYPTIVYSMQDPPFKPPAASRPTTVSILNPYAEVPSSGSSQVGAQSANAIDNIHNHLQGTQ